MDATDGSGGIVETAAHLHLLAHLRGKFRGNVKSFWLAVDDNGNLELGVPLQTNGLELVPPLPLRYRWRGARNRFGGNGSERIIQV